jgi:predicted MFS family arabinose efflux permease
LALSVVIAVIVFKVYEQGAKASTKALSDSMTRRLASILELNIDIADIKGLEEAFQQYKATNPDIDAIAITNNGITISHSDPRLIGKPYQKPDDSLEYINTLTGLRDKRIQHFRVAVSMPTNVITKAVLDSSKAFIVLFIACSLISLIFLNAGSAILKTLSKESSQVHYKMRILQIIKDICEDGIITEDEKLRLRRKLEIVGDKITREEQVALDALQRKIDSGELIERTSIDLGFDVGLNLIKPAYFLIVFVNALSLSFLPQLVSGFAERSLSSIATTSLPFTVFYLMFALVLVPAGQYAENGDLKKLMSGGFLAEVIGLFLVALADNYWTLTLGRAASGIGQGLFLIGLQSYVLVVTPKAKKCLGHAVKVIGRNSGLIAGTAIGALLYAYMDYRKVFMLASLISLGALAYLYILVPASDRVGAGEAKRQVAKKENALKVLIRNILSVMRDVEFMKTLFAIGIVGKISIAGVVMFAVPLLLSKKGFATEDIGLALMLYYIFGMLTTHITTRNVDSPGVTRWVLSLSAVIGGVSSLLLGCIGVTHLLEASGTPGINLLAAFAIGFNHMLAGFGLSNLDAYLILFFIILIGVSNGLLAAPVMTHIGNLKVAEKLGVKSVSATYVFLERFGHVTGPLTIGWLMTSNQGSTLAVSFFGIITIGFGLLFLFTTRSREVAIL